MFFAHLRAAGLVSGSGVDDTKPTNAYGGQIGIQNGSLLLAGHVTVFGAIEGPIARIIETRLDDSVPATGRVQADLSTSAVNMAPAGVTTAGATYVDSARYDMAFGL